MTFTWYLPSIVPVTAETDSFLSEQWRGLFAKVDSLADLFPLGALGRVIVHNWHFPLGLLAIMYLIHFLSTITDPRLRQLFAVVSYHPLRFWGIITSALVHTSWRHLIGNTFPFLLFGSIIAAQGDPGVSGVLAELPLVSELNRFALVTVVVALTSGLAAFFLSLPGRVTMGASGVVFGYFTYILAMAYRLQDPGQIVIAGVIALGWGFAMFRGVLPRLGSKVSWQAHLGGAFGGVALAYLLTMPELNLTSFNLDSFANIYHIF